MTYHVRQFLTYNVQFLDPPKGQLISKAKCQAVDSPKKELQELLRSKVKRRSFVFLENLRLDILLSKLSDL